MLRQERRVPRGRIRSPCARIAMTSQLERLRTALAGLYEVERELGHGGMATVYLARDTKHERRVAIKVLRSDLAAHLGRERFLREIRIAAGLHHPHILTLHDSGEADDLVYYVMPYVEGESLRDRLTREGELPIPDAVRVLRDVADALASAHAQGVVHRDIKPANVLLSGRHALVTDFGVAKALDDAAGPDALTTVGVSVGTPAYMAPEQAGAESVDHRADIYTFGVLAYELLSGRPPFEAPTAQALLASHLAATPRPLRELRPSVPAELEALVMTCLEKRPADRWQTAEQLVTRLEQLATPGEGTPVRIRPPRPRRRWWLPVAGGVGVLALAAWLTVGRLRPAGGPAADARRVVVLPFEDRTGDPALLDLGALAADWTTRELERSLGSAIDVVSTASVRDALRSVEENPSGRSITDLVGAGTVVSGTARISEGRILVEAELVDRRTGSLLQAVRPVTAALDSAESAVSAVADRVTAAVALHFSPEFRFRRSERPPPSLAAFREVETGLAEFSRERWPDALGHFEAVWRWTRPMRSRCCTRSPSTGSSGDRTHGSMTWPIRCGWRSCHGAVDSTPESGCSWTGYRVGSTETSRRSTARRNKVSERRLTARAICWESAPFVRTGRTAPWR